MSRTVASILLEVIYLEEFVAPSGRPNVSKCATFRAHYISYCHICEYPPFIEHSVCLAHSTEVGDPGKVDCFLEKDV